MSTKKKDSQPRPISIAIPSSFIDVYSNNAHKTQQIGRIARAAAIFQVDEVLIYLDKKNQKQNKNQHLITSVLEYMETPQYLRKYLFGKLPELRHVGLLPPLRTPHHPLVKKAKLLKPGEFREGFAFKEKGKLLVDVGVETPLALLQGQDKPLPRRVTVKLQRKMHGNLVAIPCVSPHPIPYWGYHVVNIDLPLGNFLKTRTMFDIVIATSRKGIPLKERMNSIKRHWKTKMRLLLLYGTHNEGLAEILQREGYDVSTVAHHSINLIPNQGTATIRTEEAVYIGLAAFRLLEHMTQ